MKDMDDLELVEIHPDVLRAWTEQACPQIITKMLELGMAYPPTERARANDDGTLFIYVVLSNDVEMGINVPASYWRWVSAN